uniref:Uncharacterized protein n=1 Tax=Picea sitchensis TaxID=3332 RepID=A9NZ77_PICSI|nr:unknown [Picea sitchensis]
MFGVVFPNRSFPMDLSCFTQIDSFHWILDMNTFVGEAYDQIKEMCIFLLNEFSLPPDKVLAVYVQSPGSEFKYCGAVYRACPSAVLTLCWPEPGGQMQLTSDSVPLTAKIGVSIEDLNAIPALNVGHQQRIEQLAMKVGENLFNFMQSFCTMDSNKLVVPTDILDRWFKKFQERAKRDPEYLKSFVI